MSALADAGRALLDAEFYECENCKKPLRRTGRVRHLRECRGSVHREFAAMVNDGGATGSGNDAVVEVDVDGNATAGVGRGRGKGKGSRRGRAPPKRGQVGAPEFTFAHDSMTASVADMDEMAALAALRIVNDHLELLRERCAMLCCNFVGTRAHDAY